MNNNPIVKKKKSKPYFTKDTENAIIDYNNATTSEEKEKIYQEKIHKVFFKLTQNIIHTFKFYNTDVDLIEDLQHEVIIFLLSKMHLYKKDNGAAFSYFGTITKRYLILYNQKNYKKKIDRVDANDVEDKLSNDVKTSSYNDDLSNFIEKYIEHCTNNIYSLFPKKDDAKIADAILELFRRRENIDIFNKKALYFHIREIIDVKTPKITRIVDKLYKIFKDNYIFYLDNSYIKFK